MTRYEFSEGFYSWPSARDWRLWATRMGFNTNLVCVPGHIDVDDNARAITALCYVPTDNGLGILMDESGTDVTRVEVTVQLESPALPTPQVYSE